MDILRSTSPNNHELRKINHFNLIENEYTTFSSSQIKEFVYSRSIEYSSKKNHLKKKKSVRFADAFGLQLEYVKLFTNTLFENQFSFLEANLNLNVNNSIIKNKEINFQPLFENPGLQTNFMGQLNERKVILETVEINNYELNGYVRVINLSFHKRVFVRYTTNNWKSYTDLDCSYVPNSSNGLTDSFKFTLNLQIEIHMDNLEFSICYEVRSNDKIEESYWDNNLKINYKYCVN
ncbi:unnamed protein product [Brachionus calyciflorus]|uniref:CBM21 domain-containing protein n=1 Tax=Brachionus calyciflorus TaxID=104777 RepID=A0A814HHA4_9BILA|nr:unnamed protein product [Brachionus calyciflorus]